MATSRKPAATAAKRAKPAAKAAGPAAPAKQPAATAKPSTVADKPAAAPTRPAEPAKPAKPAKTAKDEKSRKPKLVRDSFTIPKDEFAVLDLLKQRAARLGRPAKKSEVLRAGLKALQAMADPAFLGCIGSVPSIKTGRPAKS